MKSTRAGLLQDLIYLYGEEQGRQACAAIQEKINNRPVKPSRRRPLDQGDVFLITYGDQFRGAPGSQAPPLQMLLEFCRRRLAGCVNHIHILPFYPYSSDDGFSVLDYHAVNPELGTWSDIEAIGRSFGLMFDLVINHISAGSDWFQSFLAGEEPYSGFFITPPPEADLSQVTRPRTSPLLTTFQTSSGEMKVWTTFSADQVDLNFQNPLVLMAAVDVLLDYASRGASFLRLDAVAFLWKESGTTCLNLPQTHALIRVFRGVLDLAAPHVRLITETNIPHAENISYFGDGHGEAQLVYNFALPPLTLHALLTERVDELREWAASLTTPSEETAFFNFLASHDGIGLNPARGILSGRQVDELVEAVKRRGGLVSSKSMPDGSSIPYELNINYFDALASLDPGEDTEAHVGRFLAAHAVLLVLKGVPAIYVHSLLGSRGWREGPATTGVNRSINREKLVVEKLDMELDDLFSLRRAVFDGFRRLLTARRGHPAFSPTSSQSFPDTGGAVFTLLRRDEKTGRAVVCLHNFTSRRQEITVPEDISLPASNPARDLVSCRPAALSAGRLTMEPYQVLWLPCD